MAKYRRHIILVTDLGEIDITHDEHILRNLDWCSTRIRVDWLLCQPFGPA